MLLGLRYVDSETGLLCDTWSMAVVGLHLIRRSNVVYNFPPPNFGYNGIQFACRMSLNANIIHIMCGVEI